MRSTGTLFCLASGTAFGAMAVFGKLAYREGSTVGTLLTERFGLAALVFWALVLGSRRTRAAARTLSPRDVAFGLALGAGGYALQAGCYFAALDRLDASLVSLLVFTFPAMVTTAAIVLGRERADAVRLTALALASTGLVLIMAGAGTGALDPAGTGLALTTAVLYSTYILVGEGLTRRVDPQVLAALVCTGAAVSLAGGSVALGDLRLTGVTAAGWASLTGIALVSTVVALTMFLAGLRRVGPTTASILATVEPLMTVVLAYLVFSETLGPVQLAGAALVLAAVLALNVPRPAPTTA